MPPSLGRANGTQGANVTDVTEKATLRPPPEHPEVPGAHRVTPGAPQDTPGYV